MLPKEVAQHVGSGRVVAVGQGSADMPMSVKVDDLILFADRGALPIDDFILISHLQVLCTCVEDGEDHKTKLLTPPAKLIIGPNLN
jgi:co-chaperonin GroES (HSP10)